AGARVEHLNAYWPSGTITGSPTVTGSMTLFGTLDGAGTTTIGPGATMYWFAGGLDHGMTLSNHGTVQESDLGWGRGVTLIVCGGSQISNHAALDLDIPPGDTFTDCGDSASAITNESDGTFTAANPWGGGYTMTLDVAVRNDGILHLSGGTVLLDR